MTYKGPNPLADADRLPEIKVTFTFTLFLFGGIPLCVPVDFTLSR